MSDCSIGTAFGEHPEQPGVMAYHRLDCKRSSCDHCGPLKAKRYRKAIARAAEAHGLTRFVTLTLDPSVAPGPDESVAYIRECFNKFRTYLRRKFGVTVPYITVVELQKSGMAHLHVLINRFVEKAWLNEAWHAVGGGYTWIKYVDVHRVSAYMSKYLTKDLLGAVPTKKKRISTSRGIRLFEKRPPLGWSRDTRSIRQHYSRMVSSKTKRVTDVIGDEVGLKSFHVSPRIGVFESLLLFFEDPYKALRPVED